MRLRAALPLTLVAGMLMLGTLANAQAQSAETTKTSPDGKVSVASRGNDVRQVLYDLFLQKHKNFVIENVEKTELFLILNDVTFDEAVEIVMKQVGLKYDIQNDIYYFSKKGKSLDPIPLPKNPTYPPVTIDKPKDTATFQAPPVTSPAKVTSAEMKKRVTTRYNLIDLRELFADLSRQTGVRIEVAKDVPAYKVRAYLIDTSLKYAMDSVTKTAKLKYSATDTGTLLVTR